MTRIAVGVVVLLALGWSAPIVGAAQPAPDGPSPVPDAAAAEGDYADLARAFRNLYDSLRAKRGVSEEDHAVIRALRDRAAAFNAAHPGDARGLALELQLAQWLDDRQRIDELFERLVSVTGEVKIGLAWARFYQRQDDPQRLEAIYDRLGQLFPDEPQVAIGRADTLKGENEYGRALEILEVANLDPAAQPKGMLTLSECLFAQQRYQEAVDALESIPQETLDSEPGVRAAVNSVLTTRREYVGFWDQEQQIRSAEAAADDLPRAEIITARGRIALELFENEAPNTVANFIALAESGFYDGTTFHRVLPNFMSQGGDPNTKEGATGAPGSGGPGYSIADEHGTENDRKHFTGSLAMAKQSEPNTAGCQFYITHTAPTHLNGKHTVFGRVTDGLDVARRLEVGDRIETVRVLRKRDHAYVPETLPDPTAAPPAEDLETGLDLSFTPTPGAQEPEGTEPVPTEPEASESQSTDPDAPQE